MEYKETKCPDCGFLMACKKCSEIYSRIDEELDLIEQKEQEERYHSHQHSPTKQNIQE